MSVENILRYLPPKIREGLCSATRLSGDGVSEVHICLGSGSSVRFYGRRIFLGISVGAEDMEYIMRELTGGALYAHRDTLSEGYLTLGGGIRVGVCGRARYEEGRLFGISDISSLLIRIPSLECSFTDTLVEAFLRCRRGILIFAPPSGGKTTALRALVKRLSGMGVGRISLVDEREEIRSHDFSSLDVDVFSGYRRADGMRIALRVMSPEILAVDEIGGEGEAREMTESLFSGVRLIATAHADSLEDLKKRRSLAPFLELGAFDVYAKVFRDDKGFGCEICK
jgi:stage III sporulation protein AA